MTHTPVQVASWVEALLAEAERDLVFLWNIQRGSFGGAGIAPDSETLACVVGELAKRGCLVGFGDPSFPSWCVPAELQVPREALAKAVIRMWENDPAEGEFIAFAIRDKVPSEG